ncbi:SH3 domain-containing protein [Streptomyces sp. NPDC050121]|uniref:SH3 domain-containing protein n=1 Tax=Streptomyces sp. NPDC050121 TaxID=3365601 RepID=UPI0037A4883D
MSLRSACTRLAIVTAAGALAATATITPALAGGGDDDWGDNSSSTSGKDFNGSGDDPQDWQNQGGGGGQDDGDGDSHQGGGHQNGGDEDNNEGGGHQDGGQNNNQNNGGNGHWQSGGGGDGGDWQSGNHDNDNDNDFRRFRGRVTADELLLRSKPTRASEVIRVAHRGEIVSIFCKTSGQEVQGDRLWYLLTDGTWAWGAARHIKTIGTPPRWC